MILKAIYKFSQIAYLFMFFSDAGIMTTRLFPVFLKCFDDGSSSLRMEACVACMNLHLINDAILTKLVSLAGNDRVWKVKALAIQGMKCRPLYCIVSLFIINNMVCQNASIYSLYRGTKLVYPMRLIGILL